MPHRSIVFIPGYNFKASIWSSILSSLMDFDIHLLDFPNVSNFNIEKICEALADHIPDGSTLVGWSLGGLVSMHFSVIKPQKCKRLALVSSTPRFMEDTKWPGITEKQLNHATSIFTQLVQYPNTSLSIRTYLKSHIGHSNNGHLSLIKKLDARHIYPKISIPVLNIQGERDAIIPLNQMRYFSRFHKTIVIPQAGHIPFLTHPHIFINELIKFIKL